MQIQLPRLHDGQQEVWDQKVRFRVLACGRRWGKKVMDSPVSTGLSRLLTRVVG